MYRWRRLEARPGRRARSGIGRGTESEVRHLPTSEHRSIIIDLRFLEFADVAGIRALVEAYALLSEHCCDVGACSRISTPLDPPRRRWRPAALRELLGRSVGLAGLAHSSVNPCVDSDARIRRPP